MQTVFQGLFQVQSSNSAVRTLTQWIDEPFRGFLLLLLLLINCFCFTRLILRESSSRPPAQRGEQEKEKCMFQTDPGATGRAVSCKRESAGGNVHTSNSPTHAASRTHSSQGQTSWKAAAATQRYPAHFPLLSCCNFGWTITCCSHVAVEGLLH